MLFNLTFLGKLNLWHFWITLWYFIINSFLPHKLYSVTSTDLRFIISICNYFVEHWSSLQSTLHILTQQVCASLYCLIINCNLMERWDFISKYPGFSNGRIIHWMHFLFQYYANFSRMEPPKRRAWIPSGWIAIWTWVTIGYFYILFWTIHSCNY